MRILIVHDQYRSGGLSGENQVVDAETLLLERGGHHVIRLIATTGAQDLRGVVSLAHDAVWSRQMARRVTEARVSDSIELVHVNNMFPHFSPSVLRTGVPTVLTLHNFRLSCVAGTFLRDGHVCEDCLGHVSWRGAYHACYRGSRAASGVLAASLGFHRAIGTFDRVTLFSAVSQFVKEKLVEGGLDPARVRVRRNFAWPVERRCGAGEYFLFLGRLSPEKGLDTIVRRWPSRFPLVVVGNGPERSRLEAMAGGAVEFRGAVEPEQVSSLLRGARSLVLPSTCYEGSPRSIVEAFAAGVPVIASAIGGLPEHVEDDRSGILAEAGNADAWAQAVECLEDDDVSERLGEGAYAAWRERFSPEVGLRSLEALYEEAIARSRASAS